MKSSACQNMDYCCEAMWKQFEIESDDERFVTYQAEFGEFGLIERKDAASYVPIAFCPWCGKDILSERWKALQRAQSTKLVDGAKPDENAT
jgi:hypothetical protein